MASRTSRNTALKMEGPSGPDDEPPIITAARSGDTYLAAVALQRGDDPNALSREGFTALYIACSYNNFELTSLLLQGLANPNIDCGGPGRRAIIAAISFGNYKISKLLVDNNTELNFLNANGYPPLSIAVMLDNEKITQLLLENGADSNFHDKETSPLHWAIRSNYRFITQLLLQYNANPNERLRDGTTPLLTAIECRHFNLVNVLIDWNAKFSMEDLMHFMSIDRQFLILVESLLPRLYNQIMNLLKNSLEKISDSFGVPARLQGEFIRILKAAITQFEKMHDYTPSLQIDSPSLPDKAFLLFDDRPNTEESALAFYGKYWKRYADAQLLFQDDLERLDPGLLDALKNYCRNHRMSRRDVLPPPKSAKAQKAVETAAEGSAEHELARRRLLDRQRKSRQRARSSTPSY